MCWGCNCNSLDFLSTPLCASIRLSAAFVGCLHVIFEIIYFWVCSIAIHLLNECGFQRFFIDPIEMRPHGVKYTEAVCMCPEKRGKNRNEWKEIQRTSRQNCIKTTYNCKRSRQQLRLNRFDNKEVHIAKAREMNINTQQKHTTHPTRRTTEYGWCDEERRNGRKKIFIGQQQWRRTHRTHNEWPFYFDFATPFCSSSLLWHTAEREKGKSSPVEAINSHKRTCCAQF